MSTAPEVFVPMWARIQLGHAAIETVALEAGVDLLHIKGPALLPGLRTGPAGGNDADVLVRPSHVGRFEAALGDNGWERRTAFETGSAFHHAANWYHPSWGYVDLHALWPGPRVDPEIVFGEFAAGGHHQEIAHVPCRVPNRTAQILILVLHAGRSPGRGTDIVSAWHGIDEDERRVVREMATRLEAGTGLAAGLGELDAVVGDPTADLWRFHSLGGTRVEEWQARFRAAPTRRAAARVLLEALRVNRDFLRLELGRPPTRADVARRQWRRIRVLAREIGPRLRLHFTRRP